MTDSPPRSPLGGLSIVSLVDDVLPWLSGAFVDLGADVEVPANSGRDAVRDSVRHLLVTRGKRLTGSLANDEDRLVELLAGAHALLVTPTALSSLGYDATELQRRFPHLVVAVITDFGLTGERSDWLGTEVVYQALSGALSRSGKPGRPPLPVPGELFLRSAAHEIAFAVLVAIYRSRTTDGCAGAILDCSIFEAGAACLDPSFGISGSGTPDTAGSNGRPDAANVYPIFRVSDGYVRLCLLAKGQWLAMRSWMGDPPELMGDDLLTNPGRWARNDLIVPMIGDFLAPLDCRTIIDQCHQRRIPGARVLSLSEVLAEEHYLSSGVLTEVGNLDDSPVIAAEGMVTVDGRRQVPRPALNAPASTAHWSVPNRNPGPHPLSGITVLDLGVIVAGAAVGQLFAQVGARVIRVENINFPDGMRRSFDWSTPAQARGHRGKESIGLDLRTEEGCRVFRRLAADADIVTSNFKPGTLARLGIAYEDLIEVNPDIVCVESSAFGDSGPWRTAMGYGPLVRAASGQTWLWREDRDDDYFGDGITVYPDHLVGRVCAFAALACLLDARRTMHGAHVKVAQCDVGLVQLAEHLAHESMTPGSVAPPGRPPHALGNVLFPARGDDQWCVVDPQTPAQLDALCRLLASSVDGDLESDLARLVRDREADEVARWLQERGIPAARVMRTADMRHDAALKSRDWHQVTHVAGTADEVLVERYPVLASDFVLPDLAPMPLFGADTRAVLASFGFSSPEIDSLFAEGVAQQSTALTTEVVTPPDLNAMDLR